MAININNNVLLQTNTPYAFTLTDITPPAPAANLYPDGTLMFIRDTVNDTVKMYQSQLQGNAWAEIGFGGGGGLGFQNVMTNDPNLSDNVVSDFANNYWEIGYASRLTFNTQFGAYGLATMNLQQSEAYFGYIDGTAQGILTFYNLSSKCCYTSWNSGTTFAKGYLIDYDNNEFDFGDFNGLSTNNGKPCAVFVQAANDSVNVYGEAAVTLTTDALFYQEANAGAGSIRLNGTALTVASGGTGATVHLKINVNGTPYTIQMKAL